jgi:hypothetical protein
MLFCGQGDFGLKGEVNAFLRLHSRFPHALFLKLKVFSMHHFCSMILSFYFVFSIPSDHVRNISVSHNTAHSSDACAHALLWLLTRPSLSALWQSPARRTAVIALYKLIQVCERLCVCEYTCGCMLLFRTYDIAHRLHCIRSCPDPILFVTHCLLKLPISFVSLSGLGFDSIFFFLNVPFRFLFPFFRSVSLGAHRIARTAGASAI